MRVLHVVQLHLTCKGQPGERMLMQVWSQQNGERVKSVNRPLAQKLSTAAMPFDEAKFVEAAREAVKDQLGYIADASQTFDPKKRPSSETFPPSKAEIGEVSMVGHRFELIESPSYLNLNTVYHLYTLEVEVSGLPNTDFISFKQDKNQMLFFGWRWTSWPETFQVLQAQTSIMDQEKNAAVKAAAAAAGSLTQASVALSRFNANSAAKDTQELASHLRRSAAKIRAMGELSTDPQYPIPAGPLFPPLHTWRPRQASEGIPWSDDMDFDNTAGQEAAVRQLLASCPTRPSSGGAPSLLGWLFCKEGCNHTGNARPLGVIE